MFENSLCVFVFTILTVGVQSQISGCPLYGCTPGGSFSFNLKMPTVNVSEKWFGSTFLENVPQPVLGCVGNANNIVCPFNSPHPQHNVGYTAFNPVDGTATWLDMILRSPSLPVMDVFGDIIGTDGYKLLQYNTTGGLYNPVIDLVPPLQSIFSLNLADNGILLFTSSLGVLTTYFTNGVPGGTIDLNYTMDSVNGTLLPIASPVISGHRAYILTEFQPWNNSSKLKGFHSLLAVDVNDRFVGKLVVAWHIDLDLDKFSSRSETSKVVMASKSLKNDRFSTGAKGCVLVDQDDVFVTLNNGALPSKPDFWAIKDQGNNGSIQSRDTFTIDDFSLLDSASFHSQIQPSERKLKNKDVTIIKYFQRMGIRKNNEVPQNSRKSSSAKVSVQSASKILWGSQKTQGEINGLNISAKIVSIVTKIKLSVILKTPAEITSKIMTVQNKSMESNILVMGVKIVNKTEEFQILCRKYNALLENTNYVIAIDTGIDMSNSTLLWLVAPTNDVEIKGQIIGIPLSDSMVDNVKNDIIIAFSMTETYTQISAIGSHE